MEPSQVRDLALARRLIASGAARQIRESSDLSQVNLADLCGVTPGAIALWERAERRPRGQEGAAYGRVLRELLAGELQAAAE